MDERVDVADDNLPAARQARVELARLVNAAVVALDELLVLLDVLGEDLVPCAGRLREQASTGAVEEEEPRRMSGTRKRSGQLNSLECGCAGGPWRTLQLVDILL